MQESYATLEAIVRDLAKHTSFCRADAEVAAQQLRALSSAYHHVEVAVEECPQYGPGRPSRHKPRPIKAISYCLKPILRVQPEVLLRKSQAAACCVLLTNGPPQGEMAHRARESLHAYKNQHGVEQNFTFLKDPLIVNSLFLTKPEWIEALGLVLLFALLLWRLVERALRVHVETTGHTLPGWDKKATQKPTALMMMTKFAPVMVIQVGAHRQLVRPLSPVHQQYLWALNVPATYFIAPESG